MDRFINMTPHPINLFNEKGQMHHKFESSGSVMRLESEPQKKVNIDTVPSDITFVTSQRFKDVYIETATDKKKPFNCSDFFNKILIVSMPVAQWMSSNSKFNNCKMNIVSPDTGLGVVRGSNGQINGTTRFEVHSRNN